MSPCLFGKDCAYLPNLFLAITKFENYHSTVTIRIYLLIRTQGHTVLQNTGRTEKTYKSSILPIKERKKLLIIMFLFTVETFQALNTLDCFYTLNSS